MSWVRVLVLFGLLIEIASLSEWESDSCSGCNGLKKFLIAAVLSFVLCFVLAMAAAMRGQMLSAIASI